MVAEVRPNYESDWAAITAVARRLLYPNAVQEGHASGEDHCARQA